MAAAAAGGGVNGCGRVHLVVALVFVFAFALENLAEAGEDWTHCFCFLIFVRRERFFFFHRLFLFGMEVVMRSRCWPP